MAIRVNTTSERFPEEPSDSRMVRASTGNAGAQAGLAKVVPNT